MLQTYRKIHYHLSTAIGQLIAGTLFFGMRSYEYSTTPKGDNKQTSILWKGGIKLYRKVCELMNSRFHMQMPYKVYIHLANKASPTFQKNKMMSIIQQ